jgi:hypothetical protein
MIDRTLRPFALFALSVLAACSGPAMPESAVATAGPDPAGWRLASGKPPSKAEFAALSATCEVKGGATDTCLSDLGLKRAK